MLSFMSDRRVLSVSAALITAAIFLFLLGTFPSWRAAIKDGVSWSRNADPLPSQDGGSTSIAPSPSNPAAPAATAPFVTKPQPLVPDPVKRSGLNDSQAGAPTTTTAATEPSPTFDIVRVEPTGESVVAARAKAGAAVVLLDEGRPIARALADANGQVAFVPPTLAPGEHSLMLSVGEPDAPGALSSQSVAVSVQGEGQTAPMVALIQPDQPTRIISDGSSSRPPVGAPPAPQVAVSAIDVEEMGSVYASGRAAPGSHCRVYLNGSFVAPVTAGPDGKWSLKIQRGMRPGHYAVRVDQVASANGSVQARAEVPFDYPATLGAAASLFSRPGGSTGLSDLATQQASRTESRAVSARDGLTSPGSADQVASAAGSANAEPVSTNPDTGANPTVVAQLLTTKVVRGDSLWRISRKMLGHGRHYTQIYAANTTQIRDPRLIYPGQIFVMPQATP